MMPSVLGLPVIKYATIPVACNKLIDVLVRAHVERTVLAIARASFNGKVCLTAYTVRHLVFKSSLGSEANYNW